jgi:type IV pilus assembly protein PilW
MSVAPTAQRGLGLVELMVGITIGLIVAAGASMVAVNQINEHRRLMLETQIQQDLRAAADVLQQDLRRAGFRGAVENGVWAPPTSVGTSAELGAQTASPNPYAALQLEKTDGVVALRYLYARTGTSTTPSANEHFGFKWVRNAKTLYVLLGGTGDQENWQPITDPETVRITDVAVNVAAQNIDMGAYCDKKCNSSPGATALICPSLQVRRVSFTITAEAAHDRSVKRTLTGVERVRADDVTGACP